MLYIDCSDNSIYIAQVEKNIFGSPVIKFLKQIGIADGEDWREKILPIIKNKKVSFVIPDTKVFIHRIKKETHKSDEKIESYIFEKLQDLIPVVKEELLYTFKAVDGEILFIGILFENFLPYYQVAKKAEAELEFIIPESLSYFEFFRGKIKKGEAFAYLDVGSKKTNLSFLDSLGPVLTFTQSAELEDLQKESKKAISYFEKIYEKKVTNLILGGIKSSSLDENIFQNLIDGQVFKADIILEKKLKKLKLKTNDSSVSFFNVLGLVFASNRKDNINLAKKESFEKLEKHVLAKDKKIQSDKKDKEKDKKEIEEKSEEPKKQSKFAIFILILLILAAPALAIYFTFFKQQSSTEIKKEEPVSITEEPTASPTVEVLQKESLKIQILNGSGTEGEAAVAAQILRDKGYTNDITADNADSYDYLETVIQIKEDKTDYFEDLKNDLGIEYVVADDYESLDTNSEFDVIIVIGSEKS